MHALFAVHTKDGERSYDLTHIREGWCPDRECLSGPGQHSRRRDAAPGGVGSYLARSITLELRAITRTSDQSYCTLYVRAGERRMSARNSRPIRSGVESSDTHERSFRQYERRLVSARNSRPIQWLVRTVLGMRLNKKSPCLFCPSPSRLIKNPPGHAIQAGTMRACHAAFRVSAHVQPAERRAKSERDGQAVPPRGIRLRTNKTNARRIRPAGSQSRQEETDIAEITAPKRPLSALVAARPPPSLRLAAGQPLSIRHIYGSFGGRMLHRPRSVQGFLAQTLAPAHRQPKIFGAKSSRTNLRPDGDIKPGACLEAALVSQLYIPYLILPLFFRASGGY